MAMFDVQDIIRYVPNPFPVSARLFLEEETVKKGSLPESLTRNCVLLLDSIMHTSVIATCELCGEGEGSSAPGNGIGTTGSGTGATGNNSGGAGGGTVVEIPASQNILVSLLGKDSLGMSAGSDLEMLRASTVSLWKSLLSPAKTATSVMRLSSPEESPVQHKLFTMVHRARERECQVIKAPPILQKDLLKDLRKVSEDSPMYQPLSSETEEENESQYMAMMSSQASNSDYEDTGSDVTEDDSFNAVDHEKVKYLSNRVTETGVVFKGRAVSDVCFVSRNQSSSAIITAPIGCALCLPSPEL